MGDVIKFPGPKGADSDDQILLSPVELLKYCVAFTYRNGGMEQEDFEMMLDVFELVDKTLRDN